MNIIYLSIAQHSCPTCPSMEEALCRKPAHCRNGRRRKYVGSLFATTTSSALEAKASPHRGPSHPYYRVSSWRFVVWVFGARIQMSHALSSAKCLSSRASRLACRVKRFLAFFSACTSSYLASASRRDAWISPSEATCMEMLGYLLPSTCFGALWRELFCGLLAGEENVLRCFRRRW